jgi:signal transduction histidine kinase
VSVSPLGSLRSRIIVGAALWTVGLLAIAHVLSIELMHMYPATMRIPHPVVIIVSLAFIAAGFLQVRRGLSPIGHLRERLSAMRDGTHVRIDGRYPTEVQPLVDDLNALLGQQGRAVSRAVAKAGDLAHGLKTPLAVLSQEVERAAADGHHALAARLDQQIERMRRQVDYHLAQARAAASGATPGARCSLFASVDGLTRTLLQLYAERALTFDVQVPPGHCVRAQREDLDEMLGNLLDNACKWARARVVISSAAQGSNAIITIDDDGPGVDPALRDHVLQRGGRADEQAPGSGLGLAIVRDLAELYGGTIALETAPIGGFRARLRLPAC